MAQTVAEMLKTAEQLLSEGVRKLDRVESLCRSVLEAQFQLKDEAGKRAVAQAHRFLGLAAFLRGQPAVALSRVQQSLALVDDEAVAHDNVSLYLAALGRPVEAEAAARRALALQPTLAGAAHNLGMALAAQGRPKEAAQELERAVALEPHNPDAINALGAIWHQLSRLPEAEAAIQRALELRPSFPLAQQNLRRVRAARSTPTQGPAGSGADENNRGVLLLRKFRPAEAEAAFRQAIKLDPRLPADVLYNLARSLDHQTQNVAAELLYLSVLRQKPSMIECHRFLADLYFAQRRFSEAQAAQRRLAEAEAAKSTPDRQLRQAEILSNLATDVLRVQGRHEEARAAYQQALALEPDYVVIHSNSLLNEQYAEGVTPAGLAAIHAEYERRHAAPLRPIASAPGRSRDPDRPLRLGFVSGDFFLHPVGMFLAPVLERLERSGWPTVCYSTHRKQDFMTARLVQAAGLWQQVTERSDEGLAELIRADGIDLLFDLSGHTGRNRLLTFARRPAPVQFTWMGYVGTTGLSAIDYLIGDRFHIPPGSEQHYRETVLRLPDGYLCYEPPNYAPAIGPLPALAAGRVTFGSFNNSAKITPQTIVIWAEILKKVPGAHMVLKCPWYDDAEVRSRQIERFEAAGIAAERVQLLGTTTHLEQLEHYNQIDAALDTFPYSGGLTTCEACWMGVPVVTCPGQTFAGRHSLSHLSNMGLTETIAGNFTEYVDMAAGLTLDLTRLAELRQGLRQRMSQSPLCALDRFVGHLMSSLRQCWRTHCSTRTTVS